MGALLMFLALPPVHLSWLAWLAPLPWLRLAVHPGAMQSKDWATLYVCAWAFYQAALYWLFLPYWATGIGGFLLAAYFATLVPLFVGLTRHAVQHCKIPLFLAGPVVWCCFEFVRANLFSGMAMVELANTQYRQLWCLQVADLGGSYTLSASMVAFASGMTMALFSPNRARWKGFFAALCVLSFVWAYGAWRLHSYMPGPGLKMLLVQGVIDNRFAESNEEADRHLKEYERGFQRYCQLTLAGIQAHPDAQLIVWPESINIYDWYFGENVSSEAAGPAENWQALQEDRASLMRELAAVWRRPALLGGGRHVLMPNGEVQRFNSAVCIDAQGKIVASYDKMHRVPFGEYIPGAKLAPWLYQFSPLATGIERGAGPVAIDVGRKISPSICFESVVPRILRDQTAALVKQGRGPDVLVNITNDGWFWGSSEHELHLSCAVLRSVENRLPVAVAANCGISALITAEGRILAEGPKRKELTLFAELPTSNLKSLFSLCGQWPSAVCLAVGICLAWHGLTHSRRGQGSVV